MATTQPDSVSASMVAKRARILVAAMYNDAESLMELLDSPIWYTIVTDHRGNNLLHIAILERSTEVFDYLLSLDDFPLDALNPEGETALDVVLTNIFDTHKDHPLFHPESVYERYAMELIKKDASIVYHNTAPLLNLVVARGLPKIAQLLLERGADPDPCLHIAVQCIFLDLVPELIMMLLNYGADPSLLNSRDYTAFDYHLHIIDSNIDNTVLALETLFYFTFDAGSTFRLESLVKLAIHESPLFHEVINLGCKVVFKDLTDSQFCHDLFCVEFEYFRIMVEKYPLAVRKCVRHFEFPILSFLGSENFTIQKLHMLMENPLCSRSCLAFINRLSKDNEIIPRLVQSVFNNEKERAEVLELIYYFLSYGLVLHESDLPQIYRLTGFNEDFKNILSMDFHPNYGQPITQMMPRLSYDVTLDVRNIVHNPFHWEFIDWGQIFNYFVHPSIQNAYFLVNPNEARERQLPQIPLLQELARDSFRQHLIRKYNITTPRQFYTILRTLRTKFQMFGQIHEQIITYERQLYYYLEN